MTSFTYKSKSGIEFDVVGRISYPLAAGLIISNTRQVGEFKFSSNLNIRGLQLSSVYAVFYDSDDSDLTSGTFSTDPTTFSPADAFSESDGITMHAMRYGYNYKSAGAVLTRGSTLIYLSQDINSNTILSESSAGMITGVSVDKLNKTITISSPRTQSEVYDFLQWYQAQAANIDIIKSQLFSTITGNNYTLKSDWKMVFTAAPTGVWNLAASNVTLNAVLNLTDFNLTGTLFFDVGGTFTFTDSDIDSVDTVDGNETTTINPAGATSISNNLDVENITIMLPAGRFDFSGIISGTQLIVCEAGTQTEVYRNNSTGTSLSTPDLTAGNYDYTVRKADCFFIDVKNAAIADAAVTISVNQELDRAYEASSGLNYGTTATVDTGTKLFDVTSVTTPQNWYSFWKETWIAEAAFVNEPFELRPFGSSSFSLNNGYEFTAGSLQYLSRDGFRYVDSGGTVTARYLAVLTQSVTLGLQVELQQVVGAAPTDAKNTGNADQVIQIFGDATHGNFDYTGHLVLKVQANGYREARFDLVATYGTLEETFYVAPLPTIAIDGLTLGDPAPTGLTITKEATPVSYDAGDGAKDYSITVLDTNTNSAETIQRWVNYNLAQDATFQGFEPFNLPELVLEDETIRGIVENDGTPVQHGVFVTRDGTNPHPDYTRFQADDGTYGVVPTQITFSAPSIIDSSAYVLWINGSQYASGTISGGSGYSVTLVEGVNYTDGQSYLFIATYQSGGIAKYPFRNAGTLSTANVTASDSQTDWTHHNTNGLDGSTFTTFTTDYIEVQVEVNEGDDVASKAEIAAFMVDAIGTVNGIINWVSSAGVPCIDYQNPKFVTIDETVASVQVINVKPASKLVVDDDTALKWSSGFDDVDAVIGSSIIWKNPSEVATVNVGSGPLTAPQVALLEAAAKESTLTAIKGAGWATETLKDIRDNAGFDEAGLHAGLDNYANKADYKAAALSLPVDANITEVNGVAVTDIEDFKADAADLTEVKANQAIINTNVKKGSTHSVYSGPDVTL